MITYIRPSGSTIELADTPNMVVFAKENGFKREKKEVKKESKPVSKKKSAKTKV